MYRIKKLFPQDIKNLYHLLQAILANVMYGFPSRKIKVIGVTGTDGKTTTCQMVAKILEQAGKKVALASTINFRINGKEEKNLSHYTTESSFAVQKFIKKAVEEGCEYLVLETSSHSLDQYRVWGVKYKTAVITNVTREHLDYHQTMEKYRQTKKKLFGMVAKNKGTIIVNADMENPEDFLEFDGENKFAYSTKETKLISADDKLRYVYAQGVGLEIKGSTFQIKDVLFSLQIPGEFNVENALAAICAGLAEGISLETIKEALAKIKGVAGRLESIENNKGLNIIVDFALTPEALKKLYSFFYGIKKDSAKIIAIFGSCGERDKGKRPIMGEVVSRYANKIIITNDEPYREDPIAIINEIVSGIKNKKEGEDYWKIPDRREAIRKALEIAAAGDTIVITGMGNFESMVVGNEKIPWNDRKVIEEELQKLP